MAKSNRNNGSDPKPSKAELGRHLHATVIKHVTANEDRRAEAMAEFFSVSLPNLQGEAIDRLAELVPPLMSELYEKWADMFVERLFETVPLEQIRHLCDGTEDNNATIVLVYLMFMESERMEKQMETDLAEYAAKNSDDQMGAAVACYVQAKIAQLRAQAAQETPPPDKMS